jgi:predicted Mrr-cat superfamily restriction endonuclease
MTKLRYTPDDDHVESFEHFKKKPERESVKRNVKTLETQLEQTERVNNKLSRANLLLTSILKRITKWLPKDEVEKVKREIDSLSDLEVHP